MSKRGRIIIISGPSGVGKSTVLAPVLQGLNDPFFSVSATTRPPRPGEQHGREYFFLTREEFEEMLRRDQLLEHAVYVGTYYGTPLQPVLDAVEAGRDAVLDVEVQGRAQVSAKLPEAVSIFIAPPSLEALAQRLRGRGTETEEKILGRLAKAKEELAEAPSYDYVVINDDPRRAAGEILSILAERQEQ